MNKLYIGISAICFVFIAGLKWIVPEVDKLPITILSLIGLISLVLAFYSKE